MNDSRVTVPPPGYVAYRDLGGGRWLAVLRLLPGTARLVLFSNAYTTDDEW